MEISLRLQDTENPSSMNSPRSNLNNCMNNNNNIGIQIPTTPPLTPKTITRSDSTPYPTTFVQADTSTFKQVVQMLTGSSETKKPHTQQDPIPQPPPPPPTTTTTSSSSSRNFNIPPMKTTPKKQQGFKLYERRNNNLKNTLMINTLMPNFVHNNSGFSPHKQEILSPSLLDFPSLTLSPVTPLNDDPFDKSSPSLGSSSEEDKAIAEKGFYLHPSPMSTPREFEPQLLPLFPMTSPRVSESPS
ncbi:VQ motif-containing protein 4-like [Abrus precatorius]|uniref:VQ motif-containing protein 4-like n=1 Tax=Abrus precatorius TaxID=3816 RepID=A0A8B8LHF4_ABRPR|nr:VQ motif-containing protein 4-like [Abrus precatorius]